MSEGENRSFAPVGGTAAGPDAVAGQGVISVGHLLEPPVAPMASPSLRLCSWRPFSSRYLRRVRRPPAFPWPV